MELHQKLGCLFNFFGHMTLDHGIGIRIPASQPVLLGIANLENQAFSIVSQSQQAYTKTDRIRHIFWDFRNIFMIRWRQVRF
jgi:hypothetical protein